MTAALPILVLVSCCVACGPVAIEPVAAAPDVESDTIVRVDTGTSDHYKIDTTTEICWLVARAPRVKTSDLAVRSVFQVDCCKLRKRVAARTHITWETDASCNAQGPSAVKNSASPQE